MLDEEEYNPPENLPIFKKGRELSVKVAGAQAGELYDIKMEAAAIIRKVADNLMVQNHSQGMFGFKHSDY